MYIYIVIVENKYEIDLCSVPSQQAKATIYCVGDYYFTIILAITTRYSYGFAFRLSWMNNNICIRGRDAAHYSMQSLWCVTYSLVSYMDIIAISIQIYWIIIFFHFIIILQIELWNIIVLFLHNTIIPS